MQIEVVKHSPKIIENVTKYYVNYLPFQQTKSTSIVKQLCTKKPQTTIVTNACTVKYEKQATYPTTSLGRRNRT